ncbi:VCBS repeat-containing protein [Asanoa sp. NPDC049573]|uniref:FG-GAP repeat domain-containing protein n=1 Tax=Asanoa sp. NPDC049573 TaxID=3155396 RepID=UPI00342FEC7A
MRIRTLGAPALAVALLTAAPPSAASVGRANFGPPVDVATGAVPGAMATSDLDGDARSDLAVAHTDADRVSMLSQGATGFLTGTVVALGGAARSVALADVNGDGRRDLVATIVDIELDQVVVALGRGDGRLRKPRVIDLGPNSIPRNLVPADLNGDRDVDPALTLAGREEVQVLRNDGRGRFTPGATLAAEPTANDVLAGPTSTGTATPTSWRPAAAMAGW